MGTVKFVSRERTNRPHTYEYVYECTCAPGKKHRLEFPSTEARAETEAKRLCDEKCEES
jgi:hypothetical protein